MKKTRLFSSLLSLALFAAMLTFTGCKENPYGGPEDGEITLSAISPEFSIPELEFGDAELADGSDTESMELYSISDYNVTELGMGPADKGKRDQDGKMRRPPMRKGPGMFMGRVFRQMEIDKEQMEVIKGYLSEYRDCLKTTCNTDPEGRKEIMGKYKELRKAVIEKLKAGTITREEAKAEIMLINEQAREELSATVDWDAKCDCLLALFAKIESQLTADQLEIWNAWKANLDGPCFGDDEDLD